MIDWNTKESQEEEKSKNICLSSIVEVMRMKLQNISRSAHRGDEKNLGGASLLLNVFISFFARNKTKRN